MAHDAPGRTRSARFLRIPPARAAAAALLCAAAAAACARAPESPWTQERIARMTLRQKAAQMVAPAIYTGADARPGVDSALARQAAAEGFGGVRLLPGDARVAARRVALLQRTARLPLLVIADLDRGVGGTLAGAAEFPPPSAAASGQGERTGDADAPARAVAADARRLGINFALLSAPSFPQPATLPAPAPDAAAGEAFAGFARTLRDGGMLVGARVLSPGPAPADTGLRVLAWDRAAVEGLQLGLLRRLLESGVDALKPASVAIPSLTGDSVPLPDNPVFITGLLRRDLGFAGMVIEDLSPDAPLARRYGPGEAVVRAVAAGADLLVGVPDARQAVDALVAAVDSGRLAPSRIDAAVRRIFAAKEHLGLRRGASVAQEPDDDAPDSRALAGDAHRAALLVLGRAPAAVLRGCRETILVTSPGVDAAALASALAARIPRLTYLQLDRLPVRGPLTPPGTRAPGRGADCVVAAAFPRAAPAVVERVTPALPRPDSTDESEGAAARRAAFARDTVPRRIVWLSFLPAPSDPAPRAPSVVIARGVGEQAQRAAGRALFDTAATARTPAGGAWPAARTLRRTSPDSAAMSADTLARIDAIVRAAIRDSVFSAAAVAVGRHGRLVKLSGYGVTGGRPVDPAATLFDIASLTKVIGTTAAAMALVDDGRLSLETTVRRYLSGFTGSGKGGVRVRHLLTHTSGLPAGGDLYNRPGSPEAALRRVMRVALETGPGERMEYSDYGMILLAEVLRQRAEQPLDTYLARRVFGPLGMQNTLYLPAPPEQ
ncbi:MAG TPA: serine hydrolase, partial [Longimicrobium sp.]|nr:serine hydrolase [Longimicrobium sp.]